MMYAKKGKVRALIRSHAKKELRCRNRANDGTPTGSKMGQIYPNSLNSKIDDSQNLRRFVRKHGFFTKKYWMDGAGIYNGVVTMFP